MAEKYKFKILSKDDYMNEACDKSYLVHQENKKTINDVIFFDKDKTQEYIDFKNAEGIDKNIKRVILEGLENKKDNYEIEINKGAKADYIHKKFKEYEIAIEIISKIKER